MYMRFKLHSLFPLYSRFPHSSHPFFVFWEPQSAKLRCKKIAFFLLLSHTPKHTFFVRGQLDIGIVLKDKIQSGYKKASFKKWPSLWQRVSPCCIVKVSESFQCLGKFKEKKFNVMLFLSPDVIPHNGILDNKNKVELLYV